MNLEKVQPEAIAHLITEMIRLQINEDGSPKSIFARRNEFIVEVEVAFEATELQPILDTFTEEEKV